MQKHAVSGPDRRRHPRFEFLSPCPLVAELEGNRLEGEVIDVSEGGAKIRLSEAALKSMLSKIYETNWTMRLPTGKSAHFKGGIRWLRRRQGEYELGLRFLDSLDKELLSEAQRFGRVV